jgi:hypothetical protein
MKKSYTAISHSSVDGILATKFTDIKGGELTLDGEYEIGKTYQIHIEVVNVD